MLGVLASFLIIIAQPYGDPPAIPSPPAPADWTGSAIQEAGEIGDSVDQSIVVFDDFITNILVSVDGLLQDAVNQLNTLSEDLTTIGGVSILPDPDPLVFGYAKWLLSGTVIRELVGPTLAPIGTGMLILMIAVVFLTASHVTLYVATMFISFARCAIKFVLQFIPGFG